MRHYLNIFSSNPKRRSRIAMGLNFCKCCWWRKHNRIGVLPLRQLKVLLLGLPASGKTEVGHLISGIERVSDETTNGVHFYRQQQTHTRTSLCLTEIGGNAEMRKIWHHYFLTSMGTIFCFDMSAEYGHLKLSFNLLTYILAHPFMRGKPVLLVATKSDLVHDGLKLYDIENSFGLDLLASSSTSSLRLCYCSRSGKSSLENGVNWLMCTLNANFHQMTKRLKADKNFKIWQQQIDRIGLESFGKKNNQRFKRRITNARNDKLVLSPLDRPRTAPVYTIFWTQPQRYMEGTFK